jgi:hypothetical protein
MTSHTSSSTIDAIKLGVAIGGWMAAAEVPNPDPDLELADRLLQTQLKIFGLSDITLPHEKEARFQIIDAVADRFFESGNINSAYAVRLGLALAVLDNKFASENPDILKKVLELAEKVGVADKSIKSLIEERLSIHNENQSEVLLRHIESWKESNNSSVRDSQNLVKVTPFFGMPVDFISEAADLFVLMPFSEELKPIYDDHIKSVAENLGVTVKRADNFFTVHDIMKDIWNGIYNAKVVIADCTNRNPNVFYEIGIAHTVGKPVILITQNPDDVPFDLRNIRYIRYQYTPREMKNFERTLERTVKHTLTLIA